MKFITRFLIKQKNKKRKRRIKVFNLLSAKTALIIYDATKDRKEVVDLARFLKEEGIKAEAVGFFKKKNKEDQLPADELNYTFYSKKNLNWLDFPTSSKLKDLLEREYNLLIDLNLEDVFSLEVISSLSIANFKVGCTKDYQQEVCDLNISAENKKTPYFIEQIKKYLTIINT